MSSLYFLKQYVTLSHPASAEMTSNNSGSSKDSSYSVSSQMYDNGSDNEGIATNIDKTEITDLQEEDKDNMNSPMKSVYCLRRRKWYTLSRMTILIWILAT